MELTRLSMTTLRNVERYQARRKQRGTAVFIVMMALVVLTGAGLWTIRSAGLTDAASGNERAAAQTLYISEMGVMAGSAYFSIAGFADANYADASNALTTAGRTPDACLSVPANTFCKSIYLEEIGAAFQDHTNGVQYTLLDPGAEGSLGEFAINVEGSVIGNFILEMSDPKPALVPGTDVSDGTYQRVTLTSYGFIRPPPPPGGDLCTLSDSQNSVASQLGMRSHMIIGPLSSAAK